MTCSCCGDKIREGNGILNAQAMVRMGYLPYCDYCHTRAGANIKKYGGKANVPPPADGD